MGIVSQEFGEPLDGISNDHVCKSNTVVLILSVLHRNTHKGRDKLLF